jgi:hypothetical protein
MSAKQIIVRIMPQTMGAGYGLWLRAHLGATTGSNGFNNLLDGLDVDVSMWGQLSKVWMCPLWPFSLVNTPYVSEYKMF